MEEQGEKRIDICCLHSIKTELCVLLIGYFQKKEGRAGLCVFNICIFSTLGENFLR